MKALPFLFMIIIALFVFAVPVAFVGGFIYLFVRGGKKKQQRVQSFQNFASQTGLQYLGKTPFTSLRGAESFYLFSLGVDGNSFSEQFVVKLGNREYRRIENLVYGNNNGFQVSVFDYFYSTSGGHGNMGKMPFQTVMMIDSPGLNLPPFCLRPEGVFAKVFSFRDIDFPAHPGFSKKYLLYGADETQIRRVFNDRLISYFEPTEGLSVEGCGSKLLIYRLNSMWEDSQIRWYYDEGLQIANLFAGF